MNVIMLETGRHLEDDQVVVPEETIIARRGLMLVKSGAEVEPEGLSEEQVVQSLIRQVEFHGYEWQMGHRAGMPPVQSKIHEQSFYMFYGQLEAMGATDRLAPFATETIDTELPLAS